MSIEVIETVHEYLTRFAADGSVQGQHIVLRRIVRDTLTGEVISDAATAPIPVGSAAGMTPLEAAIGKVGAALAVAEEVERGKRIAAEKDRDAIKADRDKTVAELDQVRQQVTALEAERDAAKVARAAAAGVGKVEPT